MNETVRLCTLHASCGNCQLHGSCANLGSTQSSHLGLWNMQQRCYTADVFTFAYSYSNQSFSVLIVPF